MKCVYPRKAKHSMTEFLNTACDLYCDDEKVEIILKKSDAFAAESTDCATAYEELEIYYNLETLEDDGAKLFRDYWTQKEPMLKEFSNIVLTLLHELGHLETTDEIRKTFTYKMRQLAWECIDLQDYSKEEKECQYFAMPDETAATEWGINWLKKAENKKIAKEFEKKFSTCFQ